MYGVAARRCSSVVLRLALGETEAPTVVMNHHRDVVRIVEGFGRASVRRIAAKSSLLFRGRRPATAYV